MVTYSFHFLLDFYLLMLFFIQYSYQFAFQILFPDMLLIFHQIDQRYNELNVHISQQKTKNTNFFLINIYIF